MPEPRFAAWRARVEATLDRVLPDPAASPARLHAAMRHGVLNGGKRMRPLLAYATGTAFGVDEDALDAAAAAVELVHCYSLVHDDLPAMDDDSLRRGRPTVHVAFDEATAILAGDALQALAFDCLARASLDAERRVAMLAELARAAGVDVGKVRTALAGGSAASRVLDVMGQRMVERNFAAGIEARLHHKDFGLLLAAARQSGVVVPLAASVGQQLNTLMGAGWGKEDTASLLRVLEGA